MLPFFFKGFFQGIQAKGKGIGHEKAQVMLLEINGDERKNVVFGKKLLKNSLIQNVL